MKSKWTIPLTVAATLLVVLLVPILVLATGVVDMGADVKPGFVEGVRHPIHDGRGQFPDAAEECPYLVMGKKFLRDPPDELLRRINIFEFKGERQVSLTGVQEHVPHDAALAHGVRELAEPHVQPRRGGETRVNERCARR